MTRENFEKIGKSFEDLKDFKSQFSEGPKPKDLGAAAVKNNLTKISEFTGKDAEKLLKATMGEDVFKRSDKGLEKPKPQNLGAATAKEEKKHYHNNAFDKQIFDMESELRDLGKSQKVFDKKATSEQKEERKKKIAVLEQGIKDAKLRKAEMAAKKTEKGIKNSQIKKDIRPQIQVDIVKEKMEMARKAAEITFGRLNNYQELWAETKQKGDGKFLEKTRELWKEFAVSGVIGKEKGTGKNIILNYTDLDGRSSLSLLNLAGINTKDIKYVASGEFVSGRINLDTGDRYGLVVEDEGKTVFFDHHTDKSGRASSSTKITYETLISLGLLKKEEYLDKLVEFVTQMDNRTYSEEEKYFKDSWRNLLGLQRYIPFDKLLVCFREGKLPHENLSEKEIEQLGLKKRSQEQKRLVELSFKRLEEMKNEGLIIDSDGYDKIAVDIDKRVPAGFDAAKAVGCGGYIIWNPKEKSFFLSTVKSLADDFNLSQGKRIRETMWIKPRFDESPLEIKLEEILNKMTDGKFEAAGKLKEFLEEDLQRDKKLEDKIQEIIEKANLGEKLSEQEIEFLKEFKTPKEQRQKEWEEFNEQPLIKEIKDLTEKKQKGTPLSEEEQKRIEILRLRLDMINRNREKIEEESLPEAEEIKEEIEKMPLAEKKSFLTNILNSGFTVQKLLNQGMVKLFEKFGGDKDKKKEVQEEKGIAGDIKRFFWAAGEKARQNVDYSEKQQKMSASSLREAQSLGYLMKYGRSVADIIGWTAGSPLRWAMMKMQGVAFLSGTLKESRFLEKDATRLKDINDAAEEAYKIKEIVEDEAKKSGQKTSQQLFEKIYNENLSQTLLERLKRTEPGTAIGILNGLFKKVIENDIKISLKLGRFNKTALENRLKDFDKLIGSWGAVDALAFIGKYAETGSKAVIAGIQVETAYLLMQKLPEIMSKLSSMSFFEADIKQSSVSSVTEQAKSEFSKPLIHVDKNISANGDLEHSSVSSVDEIAVKEHIEKLAAIQKGEGIEHSLIRQLADNPKKFGFQGDINNKAEIKMWADGESHRIAINNGHVDSKTGQETWIRESKGKPAFIILQDDKTIKFENADLYKTSEYEKHFENKDDIIDKKIERTQEKLLQEKITGDQEMIEERARKMIKQENLKRGIESLTKEEIAKNEAILEKENKEITEKQIEEIIGKNKLTTDKIFLSSEKQEFFNKLIDKNYIATSDVENLAGKIEKGDILVEDFTKYYFNKVAPVTEKFDETINNLKNQFKIINEGPQAGKAQEYINAKRAIQIMLERIRQGK